MEHTKTSDSGKNIFLEILRDLGELWRKLPHKTVFIVGFVAWIVLFQWLGNSTFGYVDTTSVYHWMYNSYNAKLSEDGHGNLIPFAVIALLIWKRKEFLKFNYEAWNPGLMLVAVGLLFHIVGFMAQQTRLSVLGMFVGLYGLMGYCWGKAWLKVVIFPYVLLLFCVPIGSLAQPLTFPLRVFVSALAVGFSDHVLQIDVMRQGTFITNFAGTFRYDVAPACSGINSLMTLVPLTLAFGFIAYKTSWKRVLLVLSSIPLAIAGNTLRLILVIIIANKYGQEAGKLWEQKLGFVTFLVAILGVFIMDIWLKEPVSENGNDIQPEEVDA
jgi:exosortase